MTDKLTKERLDRLEHWVKCGVRLSQEHALSLMAAARASLELQAYGELRRQGISVGGAQQAWYMAHATCDALGLDYEETAPCDITAAVAARASLEGQNGACGCHACEVLPQLHEQVAQMCEYLSSKRDEVPCDSWHLRDLIIKLNDAAADVVAEAVGPYDPPQRGSNLERLYRLVRPPSLSPRPEPTPSAAARASLEGERQQLLEEAARLLRNHVAGENVDDPMHYWADNWDALPPEPTNGR